MARANIYTAATLADETAVRAGVCEALLEAGASTAGIDIPCGYDAVDELLMAAQRTEL